MSWPTKAELRSGWRPLAVVAIAPLPAVVEALSSDLWPVRVVAIVAHLLIVLGVVRSSGSTIAMGAPALAVAWSSSDPVSPGTTAPLFGVGVVVIALAADRWERRGSTATRTVRADRLVWTVFGLAVALSGAFALSQLLDRADRPIVSGLIGALGLIVVAGVVHRLGEGGRTRTLSDPTGRPDRDVAPDALGELR